MNKMLKRMTTAFAVVTMLVSMAGSVKASTKVNYDVTKTARFYNELSQYTGLSVDELKKIQDNGNDLCEMFGVYVNDSVNPMSRDIGTTDVTPMSQTAYNNLMKNIATGDILVTKDSWSVGSLINHGHCSLVDELVHWGTVPTAYLVEAFGPDTLSDRYLLGRDHNHWSKYNRVRVYYPSSTTATKRSEVGQYAADYLQGWKYDPVAPITDQNYLNCATLVYKAYAAKGVTLQSSLLVLDQYNYWSTVYPNDIVTDSRNYCKYAINWGGNTHTW